MAKFRQGRSPLQFPLILLLSLIVVALDSSSAVSAPSPISAYPSSRHRDSDDMDSDQFLRSGDILTRKVPVANLLVTKTFASETFAVGWDIVVVYRIFNVGHAPAVNVHFQDPDFLSKEDFTVKDGNVDFDMKTILPGANFTFNVTVVPKDALEGVEINFELAKITYQSKESMYQSEEEKMVQTVFSSVNIVRARIASASEADRMFGSKILDLLVLLLLTVPSIWVPLVLWKLHTRKYDALHSLKMVMKAERKLNKKKSSKRM